jgi:hypothetical protein
VLSLLIQWPCGQWHRTDWYLQHSQRTNNFQTTQCPTRVVIWIWSAEIGKQRNPHNGPVYKGFHSLFHGSPGICLCHGWPGICLCHGWPGICLCHGSPGISLPRIAQYLSLPRIAQYLSLSLLRIAQYLSLFLPRMAPYLSLPRIAQYLSLPRITRYVSATDRPLSVSATDRPVSVPASDRPVSVSGRGFRVSAGKALNTQPRTLKRFERRPRERRSRQQFFIVFFTSSRHIPE